MALAMNGTPGMRFEQRKTSAALPGRIGASASLFRRPRGVLDVTL
jgi:hypothetical protein